MTDVGAGPLRVTALGMGLIVAAVLPGFLTASVAIEVREDFALSDTALGLAIGASFAVAVCVSPAAGRLIDALGAQRGIWLTVAFAAGCSLGIAVFADSAPALVALLALAGLANALATPLASAVVARHVTLRHRGLAFGVQQAGAPAGALLAGVALPLLAEPLGWRWAFVAAAALALALPVLAHGVRVAPRPAGAPATVRVGALRLLAVAAALAGAAAGGLVAFLVVFATDAGIAPGAAGLLLAAVGLSAAASRIVLGAAADRRGTDPLLWCVALIALGGVGFAVLAIGAPVAIVGGALVGGGLGWGWSGLMTAAIVSTHADAPGAAVGIGMMGTYAGAGGGPVLVGFVAEQASFRVAWVLAAALAVIAAAVVLWARSALSPSHDVRTSTYTS